MAITEENRHDMLVALEGAIGKEAAMTLAEHLPPVGWADVATKRDLESLEDRLSSRITAESSRITTESSRITAELHQLSSTLTRQFTIGMISTVGAIGGLVGAVAVLAG